MTVAYPQLEFGNVIREARLAREWSITEAARRLSLIECRKISHEYVALLEKGKHTPRYIKTVLSLAKLYGLPEADLFRLLRWETGPPVTFGAAIRDARLIFGWPLRTVARRVMNEAGKPISKSFLNQLELGQRVPLSDRIVHELANTLCLPSDWLLYLLGRYPADIRRKNIPSDTLSAAIDTLRES